MSISRRNFLTGASACAVAAAIPAPVPAMWSRNITPPIFEGAIGVYQGVIIRTDPGDLINAARKLVLMCHTRVTPYGTFSETILEGIECDGD